jgi:AcrR family transcriptional regulator
LDAAASLLDEGGPEAVTLRAVGSRAGVSRGAPYGHFADKEDLLSALAIEQWDTITLALENLQTDPGLSAYERLDRAMLVLLEVARTRPYVYGLMFTTPSRNPELLVNAASASQDLFLSIVSDVVGHQDARRTGALLMSTAHGIAGMERSGQLNTAKWGTTGDELIHMLTASLGRS